MLLLCGPVALPEPASAFLLREEGGTSRDCVVHGGGSSCGVITTSQD